MGKPRFQCQEMKMLGQAAWQQDAGLWAGKQGRFNVSVSEYQRVIAEEEGLRARLAARGVDDSWCTRVNGLYDTMAITSRE